MNNAVQSQSPTLAPAEDEHSSVMFSLIGAARAVEDQIEGALSEHGLSMAKLGVLTKLVEAGEPLTLSEIAARLNCVRSNVTQLVDRVEADALVRRVDDSADRRSIRAELTEEGRSRQKAGAQALAEVQANFLQVLGDASHRSTLTQLLGRFV
jgi:DNA-binding MarR family transcriptional regulator